MGGAPGYSQAYRACHSATRAAPCLPILRVQAAGVTSALCHDAHTMLVSRFHVKPMVKRPTAMFRETSAGVSETQKA